MRREQWVSSIEFSLAWRVRIQLPAVQLPRHHETHEKVHIVHTFVAVPIVLVANSVEKK